MKMTYLGPEETFTHKAAKKLAAKIQGKVELIPVVSPEAVARSVVSEEADIGTIAYYNFLEGLVQESLDVIYEHNLRIIGAKRLPITFSLGAHKDNKYTSRIYSHPKALAQCSDYLLRNYPKSREIAADSTAKAAEQARNTKSGLAIATLDALDGLEIIAQDIGNKKYRRTNFTDFYLVSKENNCPLEPGKEYLTMVAVTPDFDEPGLLARILNQIAWPYGLNIAKIHSRPAFDKVKIDDDDFEPQMFYIEIIGHQESECFKKASDSLKYGLNPKDRDVEFVRVLGSYERPRLKN